MFAVKALLGCVPKAVPGGRGWLSELPMVSVSAHSAIAFGSPALQVSLCEQGGNWTFSNGCFLCPAPAKKAFSL